MTLGRKLEWAFALAILIPLAILICLLGFWEFVQDDQPLIFTSAGSLNDTRYQSGDLMEVTRSYCLKWDAQGWASRKLADHVVYNLADTSRNLVKVGCLTQTYGITIPPGLPDGQYAYQVTSYFYINPLKPAVAIRAPDLHFEIVSTPKKKP